MAETCLEEILWAGGIDRFIGPVYRERLSAGGQVNCFGDIMSKDNDKWKSQADAEPAGFFAQYGLGIIMVLLLIFFFVTLVSNCTVTPSS